jgi:hypothetical protein
MMWLLTMAFAGPSEVGVATGVAGLRTSSGQHPLELGGAAWYRKGLGNGLHTEVELWTAALSDPLVKVGTIDTRFVRPSVTFGWHGGTRATKVGFGIGPSATVIYGGLAGDDVLLRAGLRLKADVRVPLGNKWLLVSHAGVATRRLSGDVDLMVGVGRRF